MEINLLLVLDLREQAALQAALVTHGAPDHLVTLALTGACRIPTLDEARKLRRWLAYGRGTLPFDFEEGRFEVLEGAAGGGGVLSDAEIGAAMDDPFDSQPLEE